MCPLALVVTAEVVVIVVVVLSFGFVALSGGVMVDTFFTCMFFVIVVGDVFVVRGGCDGGSGSCDCRRGGVDVVMSVKVIVMVEVMVAMRVVVVVMMVVV